MPRTQTGNQVMEAMKSRYGKKKAKDVFYGSINKGNPGTEQWTKEVMKKRAKVR